jgi:hypothetical protein
LGCSHTGAADAWRPGFSSRSHSGRLFDQEVQRLATAENDPSAGEAADTAVSEAQIAVHWREEGYIQPPEAFVAGAVTRSSVP